MVVSTKVTEGVAVVTIENPPVNATSHAVRQGLQDVLAETSQDDAVRSVVLHCAGKTFVAGADVTEFGKPSVEPSLPDLLDQIEAAPKPWIAAIHGTALGGGLELALVCQFRIADRAAKLGLPEVNLGLIPGAGGTVRLPRLIPIDKALDMIATGKPVTAGTALQMGLIDNITDGDLLKVAIDMAQNITATSEVVLNFRPVCSLLKMDQGFISGC